MYILDTNAAYYLTDRSRTTPAQLARLHEKAEAGTLQIGLPPITVLELASRIVEEPDWFERVKLTAKSIVNLRAVPLPDPEQRMREIVEDVALARQTYAHWSQILETIGTAPAAVDLQNGFDDYTSATRRSVNVARIHTYRADYERQYVEDMLMVVRKINPSYDQQILGEKAARVPKSERDALRRFFASLEWDSVFIGVLAYRGNGTGAIPCDEGKLAVIRKKARCFKAAYEALGISIFCDGRRPSLKRKNDYNDIHQLLYVNEFTEDVVVSEDSGAIAYGGGTKVIMFDEFIGREAM